ncbi:MAG: hypothetical protein RPT25_06880 [Cycloclasticus sp.]
MKPTIALDFDGVIHLNQNFISSTIIIEEPVPGAASAIEQLSRQYKVVVFSCRANTPGGIEAIEDWLTVHGIEVDDVVDYKPHATVYIDDRAIQFSGDWQGTLEQVEGFEPWQRKRPWKRRHNTRFRSIR